MKKLQRRVNVMVAALVMVFFVTACGAETAVSPIPTLVLVNEPADATDTVPAGAAIWWLPSAGRS